MKKNALLSVICCLTVLLTVGCAANYRWRSSVPENKRTVAVPTFRNESAVSELGAIASRQLLREFQREGTFKIRAAGDAAIEIQGVVKSAGSDVSAYDRRAEQQIASYGFTATVEISVIDKSTRKVLVDNRPYTAKTTFTARQDLTTAMRDASGRLMEDLASRVVGDVLDLNWGKANENE